MYTLTELGYLRQYLTKGLFGDELGVRISPVRMRASDTKIYFSPDIHIPDIGWQYRLQFSCGLSKEQLRFLLERGILLQNQVKLLPEQAYDVSYRAQHALTVAYKLRRVSRRELAKRSGVSVYHLYAVEKYDMRMSESDVESVLKVLGKVPIDAHPLYRARIRRRMSTAECGLTNAYMGILLRYVNKQIREEVVTGLCEHMDATPGELGFTFDEPGLYVQEGRP